MRFVCCDVRGVPSFTPHSCTWGWADQRSSAGTRLHPLTTAATASVCGVRCHCALRGGDVTLQAARPALLESALTALAPERVYRLLPGATHRCQQPSGAPLCTHPLLTVPRRKDSSSRHTHDHQGHTRRSHPQATQSSMLPSAAERGGACCCNHHPGGEGPLTATPKNHPQRPIVSSSHHQGPCI